MEIKTIESIQGQIEANKDYHADLRAYHKMINMEWTLPGGWSAKDWVRKKISTDAHDAIKTATNIYDTHNPNWEILPRGEEDKDSAEQLEVFLEWVMQRANKVGEGEPFRKALHNSCVQNKVIYQLDYLPYWLDKDKSKWSKEQKAAMKASSFCILVHDALNVFYEMGKYKLKWAAAVTNQPAQEIIDHWSVYSGSTDDGKKIKAAIAKMQAALEKNPDQRYIHVDYTSYEKREVSVFPTTSETLEDFENYEPKKGDKHIDIVDKENKMSFINWVIVSGESTPMLYSLHKSSLWENQNLYDTLIDSTIMRRAVFPILTHSSPTGKELDVSYDGEQDVINLQNGESADVIIPPPVDPGMREISATNSNRSAQASGIQGLANIEIAGNVQYAAVDAVIKLHMTNLTPYVRTNEKANAQLGDMAFMWLQEGDGYTETAYRTKDKGDGKSRGMGFNIGPDDFDPDSLFIECKLISNTPNDKLQTAQYYSTLANAGAHLAWKRIVEKLGEGNGDVLEAEWLDEQAVTIALQMKIKELEGKIQTKQMAEQTAIQMEAEAKMTGTPQGQEGVPGAGPAPTGNPMMPDGGMADAGMGGMGAGAVIPGATSPV